MYNSKFLVLLFIFVMFIFTGCEIEESNSNSNNKDNTSQNSKNNSKNSIENSINSNNLNNNLSENAINTENLNNSTNQLNFENNLNSENNINIDNNKNNSNYENNSNSENNSSQKKGTAESCSGASECEGGFCVTSDMLPGFDGGYCTEFCDPNSNQACGDDGYCMDVSNFGLCLLLCNEQSDCPESTKCVDVCLPDSLVNEPEPTDILDPEDENILNVLEGLNIDRMKNRLNILSGQTPWTTDEGDVTISSRAVGHPGHDIAIEYLESVISNIGYEINFLEFSDNEFSYKNIEFSILGTNSSLEPVYLTAHFDSYGNLNDIWDYETDPAPGADDNGSGVVAVLELAEILFNLNHAVPLERSIVFILFDGEELGLLGSIDYTGDLVQNSSEVMCNLNLDMLGRSSPVSPDRYWLFYQPDVHNASAMAAEAIAEFNPNSRPVMSGNTLFAFSDHYSFWQHNYCGISIGVFPNYEHYHTVNDTAEIIEWDLYKNITKSAASIIAAWLYN